MDLEIPSDIGKIDTLGAHFKFKELFTQLKSVLLYNLQEKWSSDLLQYQRYHDSEFSVLGHRISAIDAAVHDVQSDRLKTVLLSGIMPAAAFNYHVSLERDQ